MAKKKTVTKPGYHLKPKYDLHALRMIRNQELGGDHIPELPLVSLIDMFTILVIFLLMNFSATGEIFFIQKNMKLPEAKHAHPLASAPLISVTAAGITLDTEKVGDNPISLEESDQALPRLAEALRVLKAQQMAERPDQPFKGNVNIQADEATALVYIKRVMQTCIKEGWTGINFAVNDAELPKSVEK